MKHHILILFTADSLSDKSFFLKLWVKMLLANHFENFLKCNISRKTFLVFCIKISIEVSLKQIPSFLVAIVTHAQNTQNNKPLQYFCNISRKKDGMKLIFCIQINKPFTWYYQYWWVWPVTPKVLKITSLRNLCCISRKNWEIKLIFVQINIKVFKKLVLSYLMGTARHA